MNSQRAAWCFAGPALLVISVFFFLPVLAALVMSLTDFDIYALANLDNLRFVGLRNYVQLLQTPLFWQALGNTLYFVVAGVPLSIAASLGAALLLHSRLTRLKGLFRTAFFAPVVTSLVAVAVIWRYLLHTRYGMINYGPGCKAYPTTCTRRLVSMVPACGRSSAISPGRCWGLRC
jgi:multiple sugar transport system permease protein